MRVERAAGFYLPDLETMSHAERMDYLAGRLRETLAHAHQHAPSMRRRLEKVGIRPGSIPSIQDLERIPILRKSELIEEQRRTPPFGGFCTVKPQELRRIYVSPGPIYEPEEMESHDMRWPQALYAAGFRGGDIAQITFNFQMVPVGFWLDEALHRLGCVTVPAGVGNTELQIQIMREAGVNAYLGTPSFLAAIAERAQGMGLDLRKDLRLRVGFVAAEPLPESLRSDLEERFGMTVRQSYGTADVGCLGFECPAKCGMHFPEDCIVEVVNPETGHSLGPGEVGEVVATVFHRTYPLIRFATGDLSSYADEPCDCGRTSRRLLKILGRVDQLTKVKGLFIHPRQVDEVARKFPEIGNAQIRVLREGNQDRMVFRAEWLREEPPIVGFTDRLAGTIQGILRLRGDVELVQPGSIPADAKKIEDLRKWDD